MRHLRAYVIGGVIGALSLAILPLTGLLDHRATSASPLSGWYLWLAHRQSVTLRSATLIPPDLSDETRAARAAGHYQLVCAACHGAPGVRPLLFTEALSPQPPLLASADRWRPAARVFQTVKYGLHASAMPGWPTDKRDDEIWDMVAFLQELPQLDAPGYQAMAGTARCQDCHGEAGEGRDGIPRLDIQTPEYLAAALRDYQAGVRASGTMMAVARRLNETDIKRFAEEFGGSAGPISAMTGTEQPLSSEPSQARESPQPEAPAAAASTTPGASDSLPPRPAPVDENALPAQPQPTVPIAPLTAEGTSEPAANGDVDAALIDAERLALSGWRERDIPACLSCHGADARADYPRLQGQNRYYLQQQLELFAELGLDRGGSRAHVMAPIASALTPEMIEALADYFSQNPVPDAAK